MSGRVLEPGVDLRSYSLEVAHYLFNARKGDAATRSAPGELASAAMRVRMWGVDPDEPHRDALAPGDLILIYLGAPERVFLGSAELASPVHEWTSSEALLYPGDSPSGVSLAHVEEWDPPVPMHAVLSQIGPSDKAKADFQKGVVRVTAYEYETALVVAAALNHQRFRGERCLSLTAADVRRARSARELSQQLSGELPHLPGAGPASSAAA